MLSIETLRKALNNLEEIIIMDLAKSPSQKKLEKAVEEAAWLDKWNNWYHVA